MQLDIGQGALNLMVKEFRVSEVFGPTVQGEGRNIGIPCYFIRLGGCDFRCTWCDTPHAVLPELVARLPKMTPEAIYLTLKGCFPQGIRTADWVVLTGGNPALLDLEELVNILHGDRFKLMLETQGTVYNKWLSLIDDLCVSPKPPSAGNITERSVLADFLSHWAHPLYGHIPYGQKTLPYLKLVVFNEEDYQYARQVRIDHPSLEMFLSVGNSDPSLPTVGNPTPTGDKTPIEILRHQLCRKYQVLVEQCLTDKIMRDVRVFPQLHVLSWGNERRR